MAKSKLVEVNEKIAESVVSGYKKIEEGVVGGYKKIEEGAVGGFNKMADKFVDNFLTKDGESVEEAKARLAEGQKEREEKVQPEERKDANHEKEYICGNDLRNDWRNFVCTGNVHGIDTGVERIPAGSYYGSGRSGGPACHGACVEKDGKQGAGQAVR